MIRLTVAVVKFANCNNAIPFSIRDQLIRSASSIGANVSEAGAASSKRDYLKFFEIALKSGHETRYWLRVVTEIDESIQVKEITEEVDGVTRVIASSVLTMKGKNKV